MKSAQDIGMDENHPLYKAIDRGQTCDIGGVIQALLDAGYVIVPREPTEAIIKAHHVVPDDNDFDQRAADNWRNLIDAILKAD